MHYFIVNPYAGSGSGYSVWLNVQKYLIKKHVPYEAYMAENREQAAECAKEITSRFDKEQQHSGRYEELGPVKDVLVVVGGDDTINDVINGLLIHTRFLFSSIPCGTINDFAKGMHLKLSYKAAMKNFISPRMNAYVDYGTVSAALGNDVGPSVIHRRFIVSCGIGFDADLSYSMKSTPVQRAMQKAHMGSASLISTAVKGVTTFKPSPGYIILDGAKQIRFRNIAFISCQIHRYECGGMKVAPMADFSDGMFDICVVSSSSKLLLLPILTAIRSGKHTNMRGVHMYRCKNVKIHTDTALPVHTDSEIIGEYTDLDLTCNQRQLRVIL